MEIQWSRESTGHRNFSFAFPQNPEGKRLMIKHLPIVELGKVFDASGKEIEFTKETLRSIVEKNNERIEKGADCPLQFDHKPSTLAKNDDLIYGQAIKFYLSDDETQCLSDIEIDPTRYEAFFKREPRVFSGGFGQDFILDHIAIVGNGSIPSASMKNAELSYFSLVGENFIKGETMITKEKDVKSQEKETPAPQEPTLLTNDAQYAQLSQNLKLLEQKMQQVESENEKLKDRNLEISVESWLSTSLEKGHLSKGQEESARTLFKCVAGVAEGLTALQSLVEQNRTLTFASPEEQTFLLSMGYDNKPTKEEELFAGEEEILCRFTGQYDLRGMDSKGGKA